MAREIRARIGSARLLLQSLAADESAHSAVSRTQCSALVESVKRVCLTNEEKASLAEVALGVQWSTNDVQTVAEAFLPTAKRARRDMQDFANIHEFFLQAEWDHVQASGATLSDRIDVLLSRCLKLGCRCPTEPTSQHLASMILVLSEPADRLGLLTAGQKSDMMNHVKTEFRRWVRRSNAPAEYIHTLPPNFGMLCQSYPKIKEVAYAAGQSPVPCPIDIRLVHSLSQTYRCRGGGGQIGGMQKAQDVPMLQLGGQQSQSFGQLERFASMMMEGMARMQQTQTRLLETFSNAAPGQAPSLLGLADRRPLAALADRQQVGAVVTVPQSAGLSAAGVPSLPAFPQLANLPAAAPEPVQPSASLSAGHVPAPASAAPAPVPVAASTVAVEVEDKTEDAVVDDASAGALRLMQMIDKREAEKKAEKGAAGPKVVPKAKAAGGPKGDPKAAPKAGGKAAAGPKKEATCHVVPTLPTAAKAKGAKSQRPFLSFEKSRGPPHFLCRTGLGGPGSTCRFHFGKGKDYPCEKTARAAAVRWVAEECKRRGL